MAHTPDLRNSLVVTRGKKADYHLAVWDAVGVCTGNEDADEDKCPLHMDCPYLEVTNPQLLRLSTGGRADPDKCTLQAKYLDYLYKSLVLDNGKLLDQHQIDSIGLHLIPLYGHLIKFKMVEFALNNNVIVKSPKGINMIHPIYKEIRETLKSIAIHWKEIGLRESKIAQPGNPDLEKMLLDGDPSYYDSLCATPAESTDNSISKPIVTPKRPPHDGSKNRRLKVPGKVQLEARRRNVAAAEQREKNAERQREYRASQPSLGKTEHTPTVEEELARFDEEMMNTPPPRDEDKGTTKIMDKVVKETKAEHEPNRMIRQVEAQTRQANNRKRIMLKIR